MAPSAGYRCPEVFPKGRDCGSVIPTQYEKLLSRLTLRPRQRPPGMTTPLGLEEAQSLASVLPRKRLLSGQFLLTANWRKSVNPPLPPQPLAAS